MPGYILTGGPGAGKTAVLRLLEVTGHVVVEEAATNVIAVDSPLVSKNRGTIMPSSTLCRTGLVNSTADESSCAAAA